VGKGYVRNSCDFGVVVREPQKKDIMKRPKEGEGVIHVDV
jgi:hypothetical protein